jgi:hypothetical protein
LADPRSGRRCGILPWALPIAGSAASLAANVAVDQPALTGRVIAAWPSFSLIAACKLLMRQVRRAAETAVSRLQPGQSSVGPERAAATAGEPRTASGAASNRLGASGRRVQLETWRWAQDNRLIERWGRLVECAGVAGDLGI